MNRPNARLSVGLPVYNGEAYLELALSTILSQTYEDFELIISDNASTDRTAEICHDFASRDRRIKVHRNEENIGAAGNFNLLFQMASGEYFKWAAHDDLIDGQFFKKCIDVLDHDSQVVLCYSRAAKIDESGNRVGEYDFPMAVDAASPITRFHDLVLINHFCIAIFGVHRRSTLLKTPLIASYVGSDRTLLAELGLRGKLYELPEYLFYRRDHSYSSGRMYSIYQRMEWFNPKKRRQINLPNWRAGWEYFRAIDRVPLNPQDRLACYSIVLEWFIRRRKHLVEDFKAAAIQNVPYSQSVVRVAKNLPDKKARGGIL